VDRQAARAECKMSERSKNLPLTADSNYGGKGCGGIEQAGRHSRKRFSRPHWEYRKKARNCYYPPLFSLCLRQEYIRICSPAAAMETGRVREPMVLWAVMQVVRTHLGLIVSVQSGVSLHGGQRSVATDVDGRERETHTKYSPHVRVTRRVAIEEGIWREMSIAAATLT
jgi:hypothetical protein